MTLSLFPENLSAFVMLYFVIDVGDINKLFFQLKFLLCSLTVTCQEDGKTEERKICIERNREEAESWCEFSRFSGVLLDIRCVTVL